MEFNFLENPGNPQEGRGGEKMTKRLNCRRPLLERKRAQELNTLGTLVRKEKALEERSNSH